MTKQYYITWSETRNKITTDYVRLRYGRTVKEVKEQMALEQSYRKQIKKPYMFFLKVSLSRPYDAARRHLGHFYY